MSLLYKGYHKIRNSAKKHPMLRTLYHAIRRLPTIRQDEIDQKIRNKDFKGIIHPSVGQEKVIVSLTSFPARLQEIHYTIHSLLNQSLPLTAVKLWLKEEDFLTMAENPLPKSLLELQQYGLEICWIQKNIRSYAKLIPALETEPDALIITADDDLYYSSDWAEKLYREHLKYPEDIIAHRAHWFSYQEDGTVAKYNDWPKCIEGACCRFANFPTSGGGILYPPGSLFSDISRQDLYTKLAPKADDIWFWAMAVKNHRKIRVPKDSQRDLLYDSEAMQTGNDRLSAVNVEDGGNDTQLKAVLDAYPEIQEILRAEHEYHVIKEQRD